MQSFREYQGEIKKAFLNEQCKEIEENNRMRRTRYLFKKIRVIKGPFHARMDIIKDRNSQDLIKVEEINNTQKNYTKRS